MDHITAGAANLFTAIAFGDSDYYADLDRIRAAGLEYAENGIAAGDTTPMDAPFSGEWADSLAGQDVLDAAGIKARFSDLEDYEQTDALDAWEDGYRSADWPGEARRYMVRSVGIDGRSGYENTPALTREDADALVARLNTLSHVRRATVEPVAP